MGPTQKALNNITKNMSKREYQVLIDPLLNALDFDYKIKMECDVKNKIERILNLLTNEIEHKLFNLENGKEVITKEDFDVALNNAKSIL